MIGLADIVVALIGIALVLFSIWDGFESLILSRTLARGWRPTRAFYAFLRPQVQRYAAKLEGSRSRHSFLVWFGPLSLMTLVGFWAGSIIVGFACIYSGMHVKFANGSVGFPQDLYFSGVTFFTLGYGDIAPVDGLGRLLSVLEAGTGLGFLALAIGCFPVFYQAIQKREYYITILDSRAGSDPSGYELLRRYSEAKCMHELRDLLREYEKWGAEMLECYLSYPTLAAYRSQHQDQNWIKTSTAILDACALIESGINGDDDWIGPLMFQSKCTVAMLRHVLVDLAYLIGMAPDEHRKGRLSPALREQIRDDLAIFGLILDRSPEANFRLSNARERYEPFAASLGRGLVMDLPKWHPEKTGPDNWEISAWDGFKHDTEGDL